MAIEWFLMTYCYTDTSAYHSTLIREVSCRWQLTQRPTTDQHAKNKTSECSALNGILYHTPFLEAQGYMQKRGRKTSRSQRWRVTSRKQCFPGTKRQSHTATIKYDRSVKALAKAPPQSKAGNTPSSGCSTLTGPDLGRTQHKVI